MSKENKNGGFSPEKEENFLKRLPSNSREKNLGQELKTQLAEDFGILEFTLKYKFNDDGKIIDLLSGEEIVELTSRGGNDEETKSITKIEEGLKNNPKQTWIHFSPKNEELGYDQNSVDFWRVENGQVIWNRINVRNDFAEMNKTRKFLSGEKEAKDKMEIVGLPIAVDNLKLTELFDFFKLNESKNSTDLNYIEKIVNKYLSEFKKDSSLNLTENSDSIFRLYSFCFNALKNRKNENEVIISRNDLENYMYGVMNNIAVEKSSGCAATTRVGSFGEKIGYYISTNGEVKYGEIPDNFNECKKCGCWYSGDKCPFC